MGGSPSSAGERWRRTRSIFCRFGPRRLICRRSLLTIRTHPALFAFANPERVRGILERAGFRDIEITAYDEPVGSGDLNTMLAVCSRVGALGHNFLRENP